MVARQQVPRQQQQNAALQRASGASPLLCVRPRHVVGGGASVASQLEHLAFQFFAQTGASSLAGCTDVEFWTRLVPQRAQADAAIYHASVSVGALLMGAHHAAEDQSHLSTLSALSTPLTLRAQLTTLAIERQNRAIQSTVRGMESGSPSKRPTDADTVTFILLFCIEALQGREVEALQLFQHGIQALAAQLSRTAATHTQTTMATGLAAQLDRIQLQCGMFNAGTANAASPARKNAMARLLTCPPSDPFASLDAARDEMSDLIATVQSTVAARWGDVHDAASDATHNADAVQTQALESALHGWRVRFAQYVASSREPSDVVMTSLLRLRDLIARIWMADAPGHSEVVYDDYVGVFADIAAEAERCLRGMCGEGQNQLPAPFTFEMGLIPPLYWALLKCRHPRLRRRILALLRQAPAQEGLWSRDIMIQVAERVIVHEESGSGALADGSVDRLYSAGLVGGLDLPLPPEEARIKIVRINLRTTLADGRQGDQVMCFGMPYGVGGGLHIVLEFDALCETTK